MNDNRRSFLKKVSIVSAAALNVPGTFTVSANERKQVAGGDIPKTWLFQGDSITDGGRSYNSDWNHVYGQDYVYMITARLNYDYSENGYKIFNRGISGNTVNDLIVRWQKDTIDIKPDLLSILVGINDVFAVVVKGEKITADDFGQSYDTLLAQTVRELPAVKLVICEPFILPVGMVKNKLALWNIEVQKRQPVVKALAAKYNAVFVPLQEAFNKAATKVTADHWIWDGIHPMPAGHELIAREWLKTVKMTYQIT